MAAPTISGFLVFFLALFLGGTPDVDLGFVDTFNEPGSPVPAPTTTEPPSTTTTGVDSATTTETLVDRDGLADAVAAAGFPDLELIVAGEVVTVRGSIPDPASRRVVLERVLGQDGVSEVVDELTVDGVAMSGASLQVEVDRSSAVLSGRVSSDEAVDQVTRILSEVFLEDQIDVEQVEIDPDATALERVTVRGSIADEATVERLEGVLLSISSLQFDVNVEIAPKARMELMLDALLDETPIEFELGSAEVTSQAALVLDEVAAVLTQFPAASVEIGGHTDAQGPADANLVLSGERARTVRRELLDRGVDNTMRTVGYGERRPKASPEVSAADQRANRRIEFRLA